MRLLFPCLLILCLPSAKADNVPPPPADLGEVAAAVPDLDDLDIPPPPPTLDDLGEAELVNNPAPVGAPALPTEAELLEDVPPPPRHPKWTCQGRRSRSRWITRSRKRMEAS